MKRLILPLAVFAALVALLGAGLVWQRDGLRSPLIGKPAPAFSTTKLHAPERTMTLSDITGQPALVNVWASWCRACRSEHEQVMALSKQVPIYGLNYKDERPAARAWLQRHGNAYRATLFDPEGNIGMDWGVYGVPETYLLDAQGVVRYKHVGALTPGVVSEELVPRIQRLQEDAG